MRPADIDIPSPMVSEPLAAAIMNGAKAAAHEMSRAPRLADEQQLLVAEASRLRQAGRERARAMLEHRAKPNISSHEKFMCFVGGVFAVFALPVIGNALAGAAANTGGRYASRKLGLDNES